MQKAEARPMKRTFTLTVDNGKQAIKSVWQACCAYLELGKSVDVVVNEAKDTRSIKQNRRMWALLTDLSKQLQWPVNGKLEWLEPEDFKDILSAGLVGEQRVAAGVSGGFVILGKRTSKMTIKEMIELQDFIEYVGNERGVVWYSLGENGNETNQPK